jgi:hypothetical protein
LNRAGAINGLVVGGTAAQAICCTTVSYRCTAPLDIAKHAAK